MPAKFPIGDLVQVMEHYEREAGRQGKVADPAFPIKKHQERHNHSRYEGHVRVDASGSNFYWIEFTDHQSGHPSSAEIDEFALRRVE